MVSDKSVYKIKVNFSSDWRIQNKLNSKMARSSSVVYNLTEDDWPKENEEFETILFAFRNIKSSAGTFSSQFAIMIHKHLHQYDVRDELKNKKNLLLNECEIKEIFGHTAQYLKYVEQATNYNLTRKIVAFLIQKNLWISIYFDGDSEENFDISEKIFKSIKITKGSLVPRAVQ